MIKLTTTQARAVASKIRERLREHNNQVRDALRKEFKESDDYKNKRREIHELVVTIWQTHLKTGLDYSIGVTRYNSRWMLSETDMEDVEKYLSEEVIDDFYCEACQKKAKHIKRISIHKVYEKQIIV